MPARTEAGTAYIRFKGDFSEVNRQLQQLGKSQLGIGDAAKDSSKQSQQAERDRQKALKESTRQTRFLSSSTHSFGREVDHVHRKTEVLGGGLFRTNARLNLLKSTIGVVKFPAFAAAAGVATEALGALSAGAVGLVGALGPLTGAVALYPALLTTFGQAAGVVAVAGVKDLTDALGGNQQALQRLTPEARKFLEQIQEMKPQWAGLKKEVQGNLFEGVGKGLETARKNFPRLQKALAGTATVMGTVAERFGKLLGSKGFGRDFSRITSTNSKLLGRLGTAGIFLGKALADILVAARPLVNWFGRLAERFGEWAAAQTQAGRESGRLQHFFRQTTKVADQLIRIITNLGAAFIDMGKAAAPLGRDLLDAFEKVTLQFREFTSSAEGKNAMADYFNKAKAPLFAFFNLVGDLGAALIRISQQQTLTPILKQLDEELLPALETMIKSTTQAFGPALVNLLVQLAKLFTVFGGTSGPLVIATNALAAIAETLNFLLQNVPGLKQILVFFVGFAALTKAFKFAGMITGAKTLLPLLKTILTRLGLISATTASGSFLPLMAGRGGRGAVRGRGLPPGAIAPIPQRAPAPHAPAPHGLGGLGHIGTALTAGGIAEKAGVIRGNVLGGVLKQFPGLGKVAASGFVRGFAGAIPEVFAAFAIFDALETAMQGDWTELGKKGAGALVGGLVGSLAGPEGAVLGAALGETLGPMVIDNIFGDIGGTLKNVGIALAAGTFTGMTAPLSIAGALTAKAFGVSFSDELGKVPIIGGLFGGGDSGDTEAAAKPVRHLVDIINGILTAGKGPLDIYGKKVAELGIKTAKALDPVREKVLNLPKAVGRGFTALTEMWKGKLGELGGITKRNMANVVAAMQQGPEQGRQAIQKVFEKMITNIDNLLDRNKISVQQWSNRVNQILQQEFALFGVKGGETIMFHGAPVSPIFGGGAGHKRRTQQGQQRGGGIEVGVPGRGSGDKVPTTILTEPGEKAFILNRNASGKLDQLRALNSRFPRFKKGGNLPTSFRGSTPGVIDDISAAALNMVVSGAGQVLAVAKKQAQPAMGAMGPGAPGGWSPIDQLATKFGLSPGTLIGRLGQPGSWHGVPDGPGRARATDYSNGYATPGEKSFGMKVARRFGSGLLELIHTPLGFSIKDGQKVAPYATADHYDHVHVAFQKGGMLDPEKFQRLNRKYGHRWYKHRLRRGGVAPPAHGSHWLKLGHYNMDQAATLLWQAGLSPSQASDLSRVIEQESGGDPHSGPSSAGAKGLFQILTQGVPGNLYDPRINALNAAALYKSRGMQPWDASRSGWSAHGGTIKPALVGGAGTAGGAAGGAGKTAAQKFTTAFPGIGGGLLQKFQQELAPQAFGAAGKAVADARQAVADAATPAEKIAAIQQLNAAIDAQGGLKGARGDYRRAKQAVRRIRRGGVTRKERKALKAAKSKKRQALEALIAAEQGATPAAADGTGEDPAQALADAMAQLATDVEDLKKSIDQQNAIAQSEIATGLAEAKRAFADLLSGELGGRVTNRGHTAGAGAVVRT